jgi:hypothetical protein
MMNATIRKLLYSQDYSYFDLLCLRNNVPKKPMQKFRAVTFFFRFLFLILLTASSINVEVGHAHAMPSTFSSANSSESFAVVSAMHGDQKTSHKHHEHSGDCHACSTCTCQVLLPVQTIKLDYNPVITSFCLFNPIVTLPEVTLSRFIPPRNAA